MDKRGKKSLRKKLDSLGKEKTKTEVKDGIKLKQQVFHGAYWLNCWGFRIALIYMVQLYYGELDFWQRNAIRRLFGSTFVFEWPLYWIDEFNWFEQSMIHAKSMVPLWSCPISSGNLKTCWVAMIVSLTLTSCLANLDSWKGWSVEWQRVWIRHHFTGRNSLYLMVCLVEDGLLSAL